MNLLRSIPLAALLAVGALTTTPARSNAAQQHQVARSYQDGYSQGYNETQQNKCLDGDRFEQNYQNSYLPRAQSNADYYAGTADGAYYQGYLNGLQDAHDDAAYACN